MTTFALSGESVSLLRSQWYKRQAVISLRGDILSPSLDCMSWNNPFLYNFGSTYTETWPCSAHISIRPLC